MSGVEGSGSWRERFGRLPFFWLSLTIWFALLPVLVVAELRTGPVWSVVSNVLNAVVGAQSAVVVGALTVDVWRARKQRQDELTWLRYNAPSILEAHAVLRSLLAEVADSTYELVRPILPTGDRVSSRALRADLERPPVLRGPLGSPEAGMFLAQLRRRLDGPLATARSQVQSVAEALSLEAAGVGPGLDDAIVDLGARDGRLEATDVTWESLRFSAAMVDKSVGDLVDPLLVAPFQARLIDHVVQRTERTKNELAETARSIGLSPPDAAAAENRLMLARTSPFPRIRREGRNLVHHVERLAMECREHDNPEAHDPRIYELASATLHSVARLHELLREQTVVVLEITERGVPTDPLIQTIQNVVSASQAPAYELVDREWEMDRERVGDPSRYLRSPGS